jgi:hypothetical protein
MNLIFSSWSFCWAEVLHCKLIAVNHFVNDCPKAVETNTKYAAIFQKQNGAVLKSSNCLLLQVFPRGRIPAIHA